MATKADLPGSISIEADTLVRPSSEFLEDFMSAEGVFHVSDGAIGDDNEHTRIYIGSHTLPILGLYDSERLEDHVTASQGEAITPVEFVTPPDARYTHSKSTPWFRMLKGAIIVDQQMVPVRLSSIDYREASGSVNTSHWIHREDHVDHLPDLQQFFSIHKRPAGAASVEMREAWVGLTLPIRHQRGDWFPFAMPWDNPLVPVPVGRVAMTNSVSLTPGGRLRQTKVEHAVPVHLEDGLNVLRYAGDTENADRWAELYDDLAKAALRTGVVPWAGTQYLVFNKSEGRVLSNTTKGAYGQLVPRFPALREAIDSNVGLKPINFNPTSHS
jgi:hypothetical protein